MRLRAAPRARERAGKRRSLVILASAAVAGVVALLTAATPARAPAGDFVRHIDDSFVRQKASTPATTPAPAPSSTPSSTAFSGVAAVGALFPAGTEAGTTTSLNVSGAHFCTASVIASPAGDLAVTAAHCVSGKATAYVFVPGYHDGQAPYGTWQVTRVFTDAAWTAAEDPGDDVAFLQLAAGPGGVPVQAITGAEQLRTGAPQRDHVTVIGYPDGAAQPVSCVNWTKAYGSTQLEFDCGGYPDGTSGGPFLANVSPATGRGTVIGVIGGYEQGGDTPQVSYSIVFGPNVASLYQTAVASS
ncbi:MAG TPA: trypsin-like serine protease [Trebonia sp.]|nr:trypsin-like serine protease [Trebonia sp.]